MAIETATELFIGADHQFPCTIYTSNAQTACVNIAGWGLSWKVKRSLDDPDSKSLVTKTTAAGIVISGAFNATPAVNTQLATVTVEDIDTDGLQAGVYHHELKRTDAGFETVLAYGPLTLLRGVHRT